MNAFRKLSHRLRSFFGAVISALKFIALLAAILTILGLSAGVYGYIQQLSVLIITGFAVALISGVILVAVYTALEPVLRQTVVLTERQSGFEILEKHLSYRYSEDGQTMEHIRLYKVKAVLDGLTNFTDKYTWTGTGKCELSALEPGYSIGAIRSIDIWTYFDVLLPTPTKREEVIQFTIHWDLKDERRTAVPFLSTVVDRPTHRIVMRVILPRNLQPKHVLFFDYPDTVTWMPEHVTDGNYDPITGEIRYEILEPQYQHKYLITWTDHLAVVKHNQN